MVSLVPIIVDNDVVHRVLQDPDDSDFGPVTQALFGRGQLTARLVYGGRLKDEYFRSGAIRRALAVLDRAGRATLISDALVKDEEQRLEEAGLCVSNDHHIVALARVAHARLLCSLDRALHTDFTNARLISSPRGKVYTTARYVNLLRTLGK